MERQEAIEGFLDGAAKIQETLSQQLDLFPDINKNLDAMRKTLERLKGDMDLRQPQQREDPEIEKENEAMIKEARKEMVDPVISSEFTQERLSGTLHFEWDIFDVSWWYYAEKHPGEPEEGNTYHPPYFFHPRSFGIQIWNGVYNLFVLFIAFVIPYDLGASVPMHWLWFASILAGVATLCDMYMRSRTALDTIDGLVTDPKTVTKKQFSPRKLVGDFLIGFPWIVIGQFNVHVVLAFHLLCVPKLWDKREIFILFSPTKLASKYGISSLSLKLLEVYGIQVIYWHWAACTNLRFGLASSETFPFDVYTDHFERISSRQYDYKNLTTFQRHLNILFISIGCIFDVIFLTVLESYLTHINGATQKFQAKIDEINRYADYKGFGMPFRTKLLGHYDHKFPSVDEGRIMSQLNEPIQKYISARGCQTLLSKVSFFRELDPFVLSQILMIMELEYFTVDDLIIEEGTQGDKMYFIAFGKVEVLSNGYSRAFLVPGQFFGEIALLFGSTKRTATIRSSTNCILYSLSRKNLDVVLEENPLVAQKLKEVAQERVAQNEGRQVISPQFQTRRSSILKPSADEKGISVPPRRASIAMSIGEGPTPALPKTLMLRRTSLAKSNGAFSTHSFASAKQGVEKDVDCVSVISVQKIDHFGRQQSYLDFMQEENVSEPFTDDYNRSVEMDENQKELQDLPAMELGDVMPTNEGDIKNGSTGGDSNPTQSSNQVLKTKQVAGRQYSIIKYDTNSPIDLQETFPMFNMEELLGDTPESKNECNQNPIYHTTTITPQDLWWKSDALTELSIALGSDLSLQPAEYILETVPSVGQTPDRRDTPFSEKRPRFSSFKKDIVPPRETKSAMVMRTMQENSEFEIRSFSVDL